MPLYVTLLSCVQVVFLLDFGCKNYTNSNADNRQKAYSRNDIINIMQIVF